MDRNVSQPLSFRSVKGRFRLIEVNYVSYTDGTGFFAVSRPDNPQPFPFAPSLRIFVGKHGEDDIIPLPVIENWMSRLGVTTQEIGTFWAVQDLEYNPRQTSLNF
ncbi:MAG: hypothetical protein ABSD67_25130 [Terracidiphilus sp.]|jgi:hypothetical protein